MLSPVPPEVVESDPRSRAKVRYPIRMNLRYSLVRRKQVLKTGRGTTINISSSGILFDAEESLPPGYIVHLAIGWPGKIDERVGLVLHITARTVRGQGNSTGAVIVRHEFHVRSLRDMEDHGVCHGETPPLAVAANALPSVE
jgi:PilZ domain